MNESRYHSDDEDLSIDCGDEVLCNDEVISDNKADHEIVQKIEGTTRSTTTNSGTGVDRLEPTHGGKTHNEVNKKVQFLMSKIKRKRNKLVSLSRQV